MNETLASEILNIVCEETNLRRIDLMSFHQSYALDFARGLFLQLAVDKGLDIKNAIFTINKPRASKDKYIECFQKAIKHSRDCYDIYLHCGQALRTKQFNTPNQANDSITDSQYTKNEESLINHAIESSMQYMSGYGKGLQPFKRGRTKTRKKR